MTANDMILGNPPKNNNGEMTFRELSRAYFENRTKSPHLKKKTLAAKKEIIETMLLPYLGEKRLCDITSVDVLRWQRDIVQQIGSQTEKPFSQRHFTAAHNQLIELFNYAVYFCGLSKNPAKSVRPIQPKKVRDPASRPDAGYRGFEKRIADKQMAHCCREILYWSGIQEGELLALTLENIDLKEKTITVTKTLQRIPGGEFLAAPKQLGNNRKIKIPDVLCEEIREYMRGRGRMNLTDRLFPLSSLQNNTEVPAKEHEEPSFS